jgi:dienelactone hydrolase
MAYDPTHRGAAPVGVRTWYLTDPSRDGRPLAVEVWYPATVEFAGQDLAEATRDRYQHLPVFAPVPQDAVREATAAAGVYPVVLFSHGFGSHRRQSTFLCTHLASRGFVVASVDHPGTTMLDVLQATIAVRGGEPAPEGDAILRAAIADRPRDLTFVLNELERGQLGLEGLHPDTTRVAACGHSFGGWTALMVSGHDPRIVAALPLAPAGGATPVGGRLLRDALQFAWSRRLPTLVLAAARDTLLPLSGMQGLYARIPEPKHLSVLANSDHMHFCDRAEMVHDMFRRMPPAGEFAAVAKQAPLFSELCSAQSAAAWVRVLATAHLEAHLVGDEAAAAWLGGDVVAALRAIGVTATFA